MVGLRRPEHDNAKIPDVVQNSTRQGLPEIQFSNFFREKKNRFTFPAKTLHENVDLFVLQQFNLSGNASNKVG